MRKLWQSYGKLLGNYKEATASYETIMGKLW